HRVTLLADKDSSGTKLPFIDGSTWNPFAQRLLFTGEEGDEGGVWQATLDFPAKVDNLTGIIGIGSYEGIQTDKDGNIWIVEDEGGKGGEKTKNAKQPNSFVFRFVPTDKADLMKGGKLQALQIMTADGKPIVFTKDNLDGDILSDAMKQRYAYGIALKTKWVLVHDTAKDGTTPFKANDMAKAAMATPLKRPENGVFRPGSDFKQFYYTETGDTNIETEAKEEFGGFGGVFKIEQASNTADEGTVSIVYRGTKDRSGFDNIQFASADTLFVVEDAGDKMHSQRKFLDNGYAFDLTQDYGKGGEPVRFLAEGRDASATIDSALSSVKDSGFQNDGDNEITGIHVSDGDATAAGLLGAKVPNLADKAWRVFFHQQHGENRLVELSYTAAK
ncbi:MAG: alkaline phosphatase PhoX, partial [Aestuariivirga sp.]